MGSEESALWVLPGSNWILISCQLQSATLGCSNCLTTHFKALFYTYVNPFLKPNLQKSIHTRTSNKRCTNIKHIFKRLVHQILPLLKSIYLKLRLAGILNYSIYGYQIKLKEQSKREMNGQFTKQFTDKIKSIQRRATWHDVVQTEHTKTASVSCGISHVTVLKDTALVDIQNVL